MSSPQAENPEHASIRVEGSTDALPVAPALGLSLDAARMPRKSTLVTRRILLISALAVVLGAVASGVAQLLMLLINVITDLVFYGTVADIFGPDAIPRSAVLSPAETAIGAWIILMPVIGGLAAGIMARWGSRGIQGHGIPEAMEQILTNESNIPPRLTWLKPVSSAVAIGTGGPFGAEGPIISTGGALGSLIGQLLKVTAHERKVLLAAGAAAGMAAVFGAPVASLVMAVELLLFELRPRSLIPVALATVTAVGVRYATFGTAPVFPMPDVHIDHGIGWALCGYIAIGALVGVASVWITKAVYLVEDLFEKLPVHWMWWPAIGAVAAGVIGWIDPRTLGVGYSNIDALVEGSFPVQVLLTFGALKFLSWVISLGSGTSGGTLAPLFMIGGCLAAVIGYAFIALFPSVDMSLKIAALVGMGAIFAGSSRALLTSIVFCFETTQQPATVLPLLGGCVAAYLISALIMRNTIMTEKIVRRGVRVPGEYTADYLTQINVGKVCARDVVTLKTSDELGDVRGWLNSGRKDTQHQGYPVVDDNGNIRGVVTRRDLFNPDVPQIRRLGDMLKREPITVYENHTVRQAADHMIANHVGRLIVVDHADPHSVVGIITRGDLLRTHDQRLKEATESSRHIRIRHAIKRRPRTTGASGE